MTAETSVNRQHADILDAHQVGRVQIVKVVNAQREPDNLTTKFSDFRRRLDFAFRDLSDGFGNVQRGMLAVQVRLRSASLKFSKRPIAGDVFDVTRIGIAIGDDAA